MQTIAFQGERGAFSEEAARKLLGEIEVRPSRSFDDVFAAVARKEVDAGLIPIENSLAGSVFRNYELLAESDLTIRAEVFLRISHSVIAPPGVELGDVRHVYSHPVALAQCQRFLAAHPDIEAIAAYDTAGSVKMVMERGQRDEAAIAGASAASIYGAVVIAEGVEDHAENYTRFLLLTRPDVEIDIDGAADRRRKTSILFRTPNLPGSLFRALAAFALREINLTKLESRPIEGRPWEYSFYADLAANLSEPNLARALEQLRESCEVRVLGCYPMGAPE